MDARFWMKTGGGPASIWRGPTAAEQLHVASYGQGMPDFSSRAGMGQGIDDIAAKFPLHLGHFNPTRRPRQ